MSDPYVGEIRMFAGNYAPQGWMFCDGSVLPIDQNQALFSLIGTTYGGDGQTTFALPDLRGRVPLHQGGGHTLGQAIGSETASVSVAQLGMHGHTVFGTTVAASAQAGPSGMLGASTATSFYGGPGLAVAMAVDATNATGGGQPHENMAPFLALNFIIAIFGIYPTPN